MDSVHSWVRGVPKKVAVIVAVILSGSFFAFSGCSGIRLSAPLEMSDADWPMLGQNRQRQAVAPTAIQHYPLIEEWIFEVGAGFGSAPFVIADSILFFGTMQGEFLAVDAITGKRLGYTKFSYPITAAPIIGENRAFVVVEGGKETVTAIDLLRKKKIWSVDLGAIAASPLIDHGRLFVGSLTGMFYCLDTATGTIVWSSSFSRPIRSSACAMDSLIIVGCDDGTVTAMGRDSGVEVWKFRTGAAIFGSIAARDTMIFFGSRDRFFYALEGSSGRVKWKYPVGDRVVSGPAVSERDAYCTSLDGSVTAISLENGALRWKYRAKGGIVAGPVITVSEVIVGSLDQSMVILSRQDGSVLYERKFEGRLKSMLLVWNGRIFIGPDNRMLYCLRPSTEAKK